MSDLRLCREASRRPHTRFMGMTPWTSLELVRKRLDQLADQRFDDGFSAREQAEYDTLTERELELLHTSAKRDLSHV
jgi:hypothetical protein